MGVKNTKAGMHKYKIRKPAMTYSKNFFIQFDLRAGVFQSREWSRLLRFSYVVENNVDNVDNFIHSATQKLFIKFLRGITSEVYSNVTNGNLYNKALKYAEC